MFKLIVRGCEVNSFQSLEQILEELKMLRVAGETDVTVVEHDKGEPCYSWCVGARDIVEYLECIQKCDNEGLRTTLHIPQEHDDLGV